MNFGDTLM